MGLREFCEKSNDTYPSSRACKFVGKIEFVIQSLPLSPNGSFARLNNPVIRGTNTVPRRLCHEGACTSLYLAITSAWKEWQRVPRSVFREHLRLDPEATG